MDNKEEILEEINEIEDIEVKVSEKTSSVKEETGVLAGIDVDAALNNANVTDESVDIKPSKSKTLLIVLLSSLLAIDVVALIIYIIGIDKVLTFIK